MRHGAIGHFLAGFRIVLYAGVTFSPAPGRELPIGDFPSCIPARDAVGCARPTAAYASAGMEGAGSAAAQGRQAWPLQQDTQKLTTVISSEHSRAHVGPWLPENPTGARPCPLRGGGWCLSSSRSGSRLGLSRSSRPRTPRTLSKSWRPSSPSILLHRRQSAAGLTSSASSSRRGAQPASLLVPTVTERANSVACIRRGALPISATNWASRANGWQSCSKTRLFLLSCYLSPSDARFCVNFLLTPQASAGSLLFTKELPK